MKEIIRKFIHILMGLFILALKYLTTFQASLCAIAAFLFNLLILPHLFPSILRNKRDWGILFYPLSVLILILLFPKNDFAVAVGWGLMAFGDGTASILGKILPIHSLPYNREKSLGGFLSFFFFGCLSLYLLSLYFDFPLSLYHIVFIALISAFIESLKVPLIDNITVPLFSSFLFYILYPIKSIKFYTEENLFYIFLIVFFLALSVYLFNLIKFSAFIFGLIFGIIIFYYSSILGFLALILFFFFGTFLTFLGFKKKKSRGVEEKNSGKRGGSNVFANLSFPLFLSFLFPSHPQREFLLVLFLSSISTALADTSGTEFGKLYGKNVYNPLNFKKVKIGEEGGVSIEGLFASIFFAFLINLILFLLSFINLKILIICTISGFFGALFESFVKRIGKWEHSLSNFFNTVIGSAFSCLIFNVIK